MKRILSTLIMILAVMLFVPDTISSADDVSAVFQWAPVIYQLEEETNPVARENVFTSFNYDHDWRSDNNSSNLPFYPADLSVYYSLIESDTHYYIGYYPYYPRHLGRTPHEHDMTGILFAVRKGSHEAAERLETVVTYSDRKWLVWDAAELRLSQNRPMICAGSGNHRMKALTMTESLPQAKRFYPRPDNYQYNCPNMRMIMEDYRLVNIAELWNRSNDIGTRRVFIRWGYFDGYDYQEEGAPWVWEYRGIKWLAEPAELIQNLRNLPAQLEHYTNNPYMAKPAI